MPTTAAPRSVSDATRFTATTPHVSDKAAAPRFALPRSRPGAAPAGGPGGGDAAAPLGETPEQKVARLRAAHQRAKEAQISKFDKVVDVGRRIFNSVHKVTVFGLFGFTVVAALATAYTAFDMITYNKKRTAEWVEAQKKLEADSLEAARLAYMTGKATEEQIALVEEQLERERQSGRKTSFFSKVPSVLGAPEPPTADSSAKAGSEQQRATGAARDQAGGRDADSAPQKTGLWAWLTSNLKKEEEGDDVMSSQRRLGYDSLSEEDRGTGVRDSDIVRAVEEKIRAKGHAAFEKEKENQRTGGPLDRVGIEQQKPATSAAQDEQPKKKGWWW
ncbi:hypothetical protein VTK56DRAFT_5308 [Thermocarpiscus australiensis]